MRAWLLRGCAALLVAGCRGPAGSGGSTESTGSTGADDAVGEADDTGDDTSDDTGDALDPAALPEPLAGRLTDLQYRYTVLDVLGVELTPLELDALPADIPTGRDYSTTIGPQFFNAGYVLAYAEIARSVSERLDPLALLAAFGGCDGPSLDCWRDFVAGLGRRLYRRPLTEEEITRYLDLVVAIAVDPGLDEGAAVRGVVQAMMQAPQFLYRIERETEGEPGQLRQVDGWELASRWSYFLWQSAPDEELLAFAAGPAGDGVYDPAAVDAQIERMIADPRFARARTLFWGDYTMAARSAFGTTDAQLAYAMRESLMLTLERISGDHADAEPLSALFDGRWLVMTPEVAEVAGATPSGAGPAVYDVADATERLGVVTHPAFLASIGTTSFVGRGLFLTERLLCQFVSEPPADVADEIEDTAQATADMTPRQASEFRFGLEAVCRGCHLQFEPVAYAFERYDITGRYTPSDAQGRALYSDGVLPAFGDRPQIAFDDALGLLSTLAQTHAVRACLVENMTEFGIGQRVGAADEFLELATADFVDEGLTFEALARAVARSEERTLSRVVEP